MSMEYCQDHDHHYDSDFESTCMHCDEDEQQDRDKQDMEEHEK